MPVKFILPLVLAFAGAGAGVGAGVVLRPGDEAATKADGHGEESEAAKAAAKSSHHGKEASASGHGESGSAVEFVQLQDQFLVPILDASRVQSLVILSVDLEVPGGKTEAIHNVEPKIRDAFLTVLFDHANAGGFTGNFTSSGAMDVLRSALREAGQKVVGDDGLTDVLITNIVRQDT